MYYITLTFGKTNTINVSVTCSAQKGEHKYQIYKDGILNPMVGLCYLGGTFTGSFPKKELLELAVRSYISRVTLPRLFLGLGIPQPLNEIEEVVIHG